MTGSDEDLDRSGGEGRDRLAQIERREGKGVEPPYDVLRFVAIPDGQPDGLETCHVDPASRRQDLDGPFYFGRGCRRSKDRGLGCRSGGLSKRLASEREESGHGELDDELHGFFPLFGSS